MKHMSRLLNPLLFGLVLSASAQSAVLLQTTTPLSPSSPTQTGRLSRNGVQQDWIKTEPFPGILNPTTTYAYETFAVKVGATPYIQVEMDEPSSTLFVSAYQDQYLPDSTGGTNLGFGKNWLGDSGFSGNYDFTPGGTPIDPHYFQVVAKPFSTVIIVVNETTTGAGIGLPFTLTVEGFKTTEYDQ